MNKAFDGVVNGGRPGGCIAVKKLGLIGRGAIAVDAEGRTNLPTVRAVDDMVRGPMLAHRAEEEGATLDKRTLSFCKFRSPRLG